MRKRDRHGGIGPVPAQQGVLRVKNLRGIVGLDFVPGCDNGADMGTKQIPFIPEFEKKDGVLSGTAQFYLRAKR